MTINGHAVVVGGTRGIGLSVAKKFVTEGFDVSVLSRFKNNVTTAINELKRIEAQNRRLVTVKGFTSDVSQEDSVVDAFKQIELECKRVDVLINAAAINVDSLLLKCSNDVIQSVIQTNLMGTIYTSKHCVKLMLKQRKGSIVNLGSVVGMKGNVGQSIYSSSKAAIIGFSKSLAKEVSAKGINVNVVSLGLPQKLRVKSKTLLVGFIETEMTRGVNQPELIKSIPLKRFGMTSEVGESVYFIANASYITGEVMVVDGGISLQI